MNARQVLAVARQLEQQATVQLKPFGLTWPQYNFLKAVAERGGMPLGQVGDELAVTRGNVTGIADRLERDGWIVRERDTTDRRVINIRLTAKGQQIREIMAVVEPHLDSLTMDELTRELSIA